MVVRCEEVWREVSNYLEGEVDAATRAAIEEHVRGCKHCTAVLEGTKNVIRLYGDERMMEVPFGYSQRLRRKVEESLRPRRGSSFGWMVALGFAALLLLSFEMGNVSLPGAVEFRSEQAKYKAHIPADLKVVAVADGKIFHVPGCRFIHDKDKLEAMTADEALRQGYAPCVRCLRQYLSDRGASREEASESADLRGSE